MQHSHMSNEGFKYLWKNTFLETSLIFEIVHRSFDQQANLHTIQPILLDSNVHDNLVVKRT